MIINPENHNRKVISQLMREEDIKRLNNRKIDMSWENSGKICKKV